MIREAIAGGRRIVIAHPERYRYPHGSDPLDVMRRWRELGALLQVNAGSFTGHYRDHRPESEALSWAMVAERMVDIVGSDHHGPRRTGVSPLEAFEALCARGERDLAVRAMEERPKAALADEPIERGGPALRTRAAGA